MRHVVVLTREGQMEVVDGRVVEYADEHVICGVFRSVSRAEKRAGTIRRLAEQYDDPEGVTGPENCLHVEVQPLVRGSVSAQDMLDVLYHSVPAADV